MDFLPANYEAPASGNYLKFPIGKTKFRILSAAIVGNLFWQTLEGGERKPIRRRITERIDQSELGVDSHGEREKIRHFWAFACWSYASSSVVIAEITQVTVRDSIQAICADTDWGDPRGYDLSVTKAGSGRDTAYTVTPSNKSPTAPEILAAYRSMAINLEALFSGGDPFGGHAHAPAGTAPAHQPAKPAAAPSATEQARRAAFASMKDLTPDASREALAMAWKNTIEERFPGRPQTSITAPEWTQLQEELKDQMRKMQYPGEVPEIPVMDDIPF